MIIQSPAFGSGQAIPEKYTCDGANINPPLSFNEVPQGTLSLALIMDDPDAPGKTFAHWLLWNMPPTMTGLAENAVLPGIIIGTNSAGKPGYTGPCPPAGEHRYFFRLYALDSLLNLTEDAGLNELEKAMEGRIINQVELMGRYRKKS